MFYEFNDEIVTIDAKEINCNILTAGYVTTAELQNVYEILGFARSTVEACDSANRYFRSGVEVYDNYTFTELRIKNADNISGRDDCVALYVKKNLLLVVDIEDYDCSTRNKFLSSLKRYPITNITLEKLIYSFLDALICSDMKYIEETGFEITTLEEEVLRDKVDTDFNLQLLQTKKELLTMHNYYDQLIDISEALEEDENEIFTDDLRYISNLTKRIIRLREDIDSLSRAVVHLQDAYQSFLDLKLNNTMKRFTVITTIFFPLTLIVGWYGMNFEAMPEFKWKYGYLFVIMLSIAVVTLLSIVVKRKKWM